MFQHLHFDVDLCSPVCLSQDVEFAQFFVFKIRVLIFIQKNDVFDLRFFIFIQYIIQKLNRQMFALFTAQQILEIKIIHSVNLEGIHRRVSPCIVSYLMLPHYMGTV